MTTLTEQIEQLRLQIKEVASDEHAHVKDLAAALRQIDEKLLREVRLVAAEHEVRRGQILRELEMLASRIGVTRQPRNASPALENGLFHPSPSTPAPRQQSSNGRPRQLSQAGVNYQRDLAVWQQ
jgi:hypothetical protein